MQNGILEYRRIKNRKKEMWMDLKICLCNNYNIYRQAPLQMHLLYKKNRNLPQDQERRLPPQQN